MTSSTDENDETDPRIVRPRGAQWNLAQIERELFLTADKVPNWRLANVARKTLLDTSAQLSVETPLPDVKRVEDIDPESVRRFAIVALSGIAVRASGSALMLVSTGYQTEAGVHLRRLIEAKHRALAVLRDHSGEHARQWFAGRPPGSAERLARKYGDSRELALLSAFAHADVRSLHPLHTLIGNSRGPLEEAQLDVRPSRDPRKAGWILYGVAYETVPMCVILAEAFGVAFEMPRWLGHKLKRLKDLEDPSQPPEPTA